MNRFIYKLSSYNLLYLYYIKVIFINFLKNKSTFNLLHILLYTKWQILNSYNTEPVNNYRIFLYTLLRSPFVDKTSREQLALHFFSTRFLYFTIFNNKYTVSAFSGFDFWFFVAKQYYIKQKKQNCYLFKK